jgi:hypothetical protein
MKSFADWLDDNVAATRKKLAQKEAPPSEVGTVGFVAPVNWVESIPSRYVLNEIVPGLSGPFPVGSYVVKKRDGNISAPAAKIGAMARVLGYSRDPNGTELYVVLQWSRDGYTNGQMNGCYGIDGLEQI